MEKRREVICCVCGKPVLDIADLTVAGKIVAPYHNACFERARKKFPGMFFWKINGPVFWWLLLGLNLLLTFMLIAFDDSWRDLRWFYLVFNLSLFVPRLIAYFSYEKPLGD